jgi:hypothetical protein
MVLALTLTLLLVALWSLIHNYQGLGGDAELYAFQALAKIQPTLNSDLYLRNESQADYTIFSPLYSYCISLFGLHNAAKFLLILFKIWFFAAAWMLCRNFMNRSTAFLSVALLIIIPGNYGAYDVFRFSEDSLTARPLAEALLVTAFSFYFRGSNVAVALAAVAAVLVHPLMALPGVLLLAGLSVTMRITVGAALGGALACLAIAMTATYIPSHFLPVMDAQWLEVVRERSQFLFLDLWRPRDWILNVRPFLSLTVSALVLADPRVKKLCMVAMLVGAAGLAVGLIAGLVGPVAILLQGQAWRWTWIAVFFGVLFAAPTALHLWREGRCGPLCALLVMSGWTLSAGSGLICLSIALFVWLMRGRMPTAATPFLKWFTLIYGVGIIAWVLAAFWSSGTSPNLAPASEPATILLLRKAFGSQTLAVLAAFLACYWLLPRRLPALFAASAGLIGLSSVMLAHSFRTSETDGTRAEIGSFSGWRTAIPAESNVLILPMRNSAGFVWFTLQRPSYLSLNQSSGVVFSRATSLEVQRRSKVLLPVSDPDWRLLTNMRSSHGAAAPPPASRQISKDSLTKLCSDPELNFIATKADIGFDHLRHTESGKWKDWNLYDCRRINTDSASS